jgi:hypothetical protein
MKKKYVAILISILLPLAYFNNALNINIIKNLGGISYYIETSNNI